MKTPATTFVRRVAMLAACSALMAIPMLAQQDAPPPPPQSQMQGPPPGGPGGRGGMNPERRLEMMKQQLNLTDPQTKQIKGIMEENRGKMEALQQDTTMSQDDRRSKMMSMRQDENTRVRAVLTPDQQTKYDAMQQNMRRGGGRPGGDGQGPPSPPQPPAAPQQ